MRALVSKQVYTDKDGVVVEVRFMEVLVYRKTATRDCVARIGLREL